ncbi:response regulator [Marinomonas colpomeniae]|uniref:Response regulator n=1 Tax=Marinomonas colpomeniae TaxID=2774408 RepID=A0ABR8P314_9GAMM|nr:response regulator [Marinomonas colpomeniae]MBD5772661.1 response regulator [Marinomonas colpomeniae]
MAIKNILIVEDESPKYEHIKSFFIDLIDNVNIDQSRSVSSAIDYLDDESPDLIILDMSLPTFDISDHETGGRPQGFGGIEILRNMYLEDNFCPTVVVTGYPSFLKESGEMVGLNELRIELIDKYGDFLKGVLHFNTTTNEWKNEMKRIVSEHRLI